MHCTLSQHVVQEAAPVPIVTGPRCRWLRVSPPRDLRENSPEAPAAFPALRRLILPRNDLSISQLCMIASMHMPHLEELDLDDNNIGAGLSAARSTAHSASCEWLTSLARLTTLRIVSLDRNDIDDDGALRVLCALRGLRKLLCVGLAHNLMHALRGSCGLRDAIAGLPGGGCGGYGGQEGVQCVSGGATAGGVATTGDAPEVGGCGACACGMPDSCSRAVVSANAATWEDMSWLT